MSGQTFGNSFYDDHRSEYKMYAGEQENQETRTASQKDVVGMLRTTSIIALFTKKLRRRLDSSPAE